MVGGGGLMREIKIPLQDFALKMQRGLMREGGGGHICGTLRYIIMITCMINHYFMCMK